MRADRWIGYTRATEALTQLEGLLTLPGKQRMPNLALIGATNDGKSMIIEKFRRDHPPISHADREEIPGAGDADALRTGVDPLLRGVAVRAGRADPAAGAAAGRGRTAHAAAVTVRQTSACS